MKRTRKRRGHDFVCEPMPIGALEIPGLPRVDDAVVPVVKLAPVVRLPSTAQIDARLERQAETRRLWSERYLRLKDEGGRRHLGPRPRKPPTPVSVEIIEYGEGAHSLYFHRDPHPRFPHGTEYEVPVVAEDSEVGYLYYLDSLMVMQHKLLRTVPSRKLLITRGPTPADSPVFKALQQEWVSWPTVYPTDTSPYAHSRKPKN